ncbi:MAG: AfsR/SARP family transcriptional regulator [Acidimicrobiia bacterium]|nr:AfsR/SARP family transcriptional regulator [Acidimicrobiia bacterium]
MGAGVARRRGVPRRHGRRRAGRRWQARPRRRLHGRLPGEGRLTLGPALLGGRDEGAGGFVPPAPRQAGAYGTATGAFACRRACRRLRSPPEGAAETGAKGRGVRYRVLGPLHVVDDDGADITPAGDRQRRLLAGLLLESGATVGVDRLADLLWPRALPADLAGAIQTHVFRLRRALPAGTIDTVAGGYRLNASADEVDARCFAAAVAGATSRRADAAAAPIDQLDEALSWWRGEPYEDLVDTDAGRLEAERLREVHALACEERFALLLELGREADALADLHAFAAAHPLRERPCELLMTALVACGRVAEATRAYDAFRRRLAEELGLDPSASLRQLHDGVLRGDAPRGPRSSAPGAVPGEAAGAAAPPALPRDAVRGMSSVPAAPSSLVGREALVADVVARLEEQRLVTLIGAGGVGKTRVALEAGRRLAQGEAPVWFCDLSVADASSVELVVAGKVGVEERAGSALRARITEALRQERATLVLDNCEHVLDAAASLTAAVLASCPEARVLATTRERLALAGEHLCPVAPFPVSESPTREEPALLLFADRAAAARPGFTLDATTLGTVGEVCRRLDGLPLALELAAARLNAMELDEIAAGLDRRFRILTTGQRTVPRQRSLAATVSWSYDLLEPATQRVLDTLGVFAGPFPARAVAAVAELDELNAGDVLVALVDRSLVQRAPDLRFVLLETLKHFAAERLAQAGILADVRRRHALWALAEAKAHNARIAGSAVRAGGPGGARGPGGLPLVELDAVLGELRAAHRFFVETADAHHDLELVDALHDYGFQRMRPEVLSWGDDAAALGRAVGHPATAVALVVAGLGAWKRGDLEGARRRADESLAFCAQLGIPEPFLVRNFLGVDGLVTGQLEESVRWLDAALEIEGAEADVVRATLCRAVRVQAATYAGAAWAPAWADELLAGLGDQPTGHGAYAWYAAAEAVAADPPEARRRAQRALADAEATGAWFVTGVAGALAASLDSRHGDAHAAVAAYRWLVPWWQRAGEWSVLWTILRSVASLLARLGRDAPAAVLLGAVTAEGSGHPVFGADERYMADLATILTGRMGAAAVAAAREEGRYLDIEAAASLASAELDQLG